MKKSLPLIIILAIVALVGFVLFFWNQGKLAEKETAMQEQMDTLLNEQQKMSDLEESLMAKRKESDQLTREAMEAKQMAEAQVKKERLEREALVNQLNDRLKKEVEERRQAETAQQELQQKMEELQAAQKEAQIALSELKNARTQEITQPKPEVVALEQKLSEQEQMLMSLEQENQQLKMRQESLTEKQIMTEEAILSAGGQVDISYPEIRSPNVKRRQAIYFKERVAN